MKHIKLSINKNSYKKRKKLYAWLLYLVYEEPLLQTLFRPEIMMATIENYHYLGKRIQILKEKYAHIRANNERTNTKDTR